MWRSRDVGREGCGNREMWGCADVGMWGCGEAGM